MYFIVHAAFVRIKLMMINQIIKLKSSEDVSCNHRKLIIYEYQHDHTAS